MSELIVHSVEPFNAEPPLDRLRRDYFTDAADFYVRSHGNVPATDGSDFRLEVHGRVDASLSLSLEDLRTRFERRRVLAVMQCAGNRRKDLDAVREVSGDPWAPGAIGNAEWEGVALADVLTAAGAQGDHVAFHSLDIVEKDGARYPFTVSIPLEKARSPEVILAWAMQGKPLAPEHGFPLRAVVPGWAGIRSAKWLRAIELRSDPADCPMQRQDYMLLPPSVGPEEAESTPGLVINQMPVNAAICEPARDAVLPAGRVRVRGYAIAAPSGVSRVDVSIDGGRHWVQATLEAERSPWSWAFWECALDLPPGRQELCVRAWDSAGQTQPATPEEVWNTKGYLSTAWHRVVLTMR